MSPLEGKEIASVRGLALMGGDKYDEKKKFISFMLIFHPEYTKDQLEKLWEDGQ